MIAHYRLAEFYNRFHSEGKLSTDGVSDSDLIEYAKVHGCKELYGFYSYPSRYIFVFQDDSFIQYFPAGTPGIHVGEGLREKPEKYNLGTFTLYPVNTVKCSHCQDTKLIWSPNFLMGVSYPLQVECHHCKVYRCKLCRDTGEISEFKDYGFGCMSASLAPCKCGQTPTINFGGFTVGKAK